MLFGCVYSLALLLNTTSYEEGRVSKDRVVFAHMFLLSPNRQLIARNDSRGHGSRRVDRGINMPLLTLSEEVKTLPSRKRCPPLEEETSYHNYNHNLTWI